MGIDDHVIDRNQGTIHSPEGWHPNPLSAARAVPPKNGVPIEGVAFAASYGYSRESWVLR
jgi:hypothetical protein